MLKKAGLFALILLLGTCLAACGDDDDNDENNDEHAEGFELVGDWEYTGSLQMNDELVIDSEQLTDEGDDWSGTYSILAFSNDNDTFQVEVTEQVNTEDEVGDILSLSYVLNGDTMNLYWTSGTTYPTPSGGTEGQDYYTYTKK